MSVTVVTIACLLLRALMLGREGLLTPNLFHHMSFLVKTAFSTVIPWGGITIALMYIMKAPKRGLPPPLEFGNADREGPTRIGATTGGGGLSEDAYGFESDRGVGFGGGAGGYRASAEPGSGRAGLLDDGALRAGGDRMGNDSESSAESSRSALSQHSRHSDSRADSYHRPLSHSIGGVGQGGTAGAEGGVGSTSFTSSPNGGSDCRTPKPQRDRDAPGASKDAAGTANPGTTGAMTPV